MPKSGYLAPPAVEIKARRKPGKGEAIVEPVKKLTIPRMIRGNQLAERWHEAFRVVYAAGITMYSPVGVREENGCYCGVAPDVLTEVGRNSLLKNGYVDCEYLGNIIRPSKYDLFLDLDEVEKIERENPAILKDGKYNIKNSGDKKIEELKNEILTYKARIAELEAENVGLKAQLAESQAHSTSSILWYGRIAQIEAMRKDGKTAYEVAKALKDDGCSYPQITALMHPGGDVRDAVQYGKNLVKGDTKKVPW